MKPYPRDRPDQPAPGLDVSTHSMDEARRISSNCTFCGGDGLAMIYNPQYDGDVIKADVSDLSRPPKRTVMRTVGYCICPAGRKIQALHQSKSSDVYARIPDVHDVAAGRFAEWQIDDPSERDLNTEELAALPRNFREVLGRKMKI